MSGGPSFGQKVANIQHMPVLIAATAASKEPADGFLVKDIVKMTYESPQTRLFLQQYLLNQLCATNNVFVKIKVLKIFQTLLDDGHIEFKQNLRKHPEAFNEAAKLRPVQPKDQKLVSECGRIRDMANRVLDQLYSEAPELRIHAPSQSSPMDANLLDEGGSGSRIVGFGNTPAPKQPTTTDKLKRMFGTSGGVGGGGGGGSSKPLLYDPGYATMDPVPHNTSTHSAFTPQITQGYQPTRFTTEEGVPAGSPHQRGRAGGGWAEEGRERRSQPLQTGYRHVHSPVANKTQNNGAVEVEGGVAQDDEATYTEQERRLVEEITAPGGVRAAPPRERLNAFVNRCKSLDCLAVVEYLRAKLQSEETQVTLRSLFVIEALLRSDVPDIYSYLDLTLEELNSLSSSPHSSIKAKATKILMQLTAENVPRLVKPVSAEVVADIPSQDAPFNGDNGELVEEGGVTDEQGELAASLFSGMAVSGEKSPRPARPTQPVQPVRRAKPSPPTAKSKRQPQESSAFGDLLGLSTVEETAPAPVEEKPHPQPAAATELEGEEEEEGEDSLLMFAEEDEDFDPLKRNRGSISKRTGSLSGKTVPPTTVTNLPQAPLMPSSAAPTSTGGGDSLLGDLSGLDLSSDAQSANPTATTSVQSIQDMLKPLQTVTMPTSQPLLTSATPLSSATPITQPAQIQMMAQPGGVGAVPMGVVYQGGAPYGGMMQPHPSMYGAPGLVYIQQPSMLQPGGVARPVQRVMVAAKEATPPPASDGSGFGFLGKSSKVSAFDFVDAEMKASKEK